MNLCEIKCKVITPTFLYGADSKTLELRESSIKGIMRYWWRAITAWEDTSKMYQKESELFGDSNDIVGKSPFRIKVELRKNDFGKYYLLPHKQKALTSAFMPGTVFTIKLFSKLDLSIYRNIFIATVILGGFGKRSRRGFGSFVIESIDEKDYVIPELDVYLAGLLNEINGIKQYELYNNKTKAIRNVLEKNIEYPTINIIEFGKQYSNYEILVKRIGESSHVNCNDVLGYARGKTRLASPIYVSAYMRNNQLIPIITSLWTKSTKDLHFQQAFKEAIL